VPISRLFGLMKLKEGPLGIPIQYLILCMCTPRSYLSISCHLGLKNLDFSGYSLTLPILRLILLIKGLFGVLKTLEEPLGTPNQHMSVCMCIPSWYLPIPSHLRLNPIRF
jgi:hypothetical protein